LLENLIPSFKVEKLKDKTNEFYKLLKTSKKELDNYVEKIKDNIDENSITSLQINQLIEKVRN